MVRSAVPKTDQAKYAGEIVRVEVEKQELQDKFGESGVVMRVNYQSQTVSFMNESNKTNGCQLDEVVILDKNFNRSQPFGALAHQFHLEAWHAAAARNERRA